MPKHARAITREAAPVGAAVPRPARLKYLTGGVHVAPFLSREYHPMLVSIEPGGRLSAIAEATVGTGRSFVFLRSDGDQAQPAESWVFRYGIERRRSLPRGVHRAPWRIRYRGEDRAAFVAIDAGARLVEMMFAEPGTEAEVERTLWALLEAQEEGEAAEEAARSITGPDGTVWSTSGRRRGVYHIPFATEPNVFYLVAVTSDERILEVADRVFLDDYSEEVQRLYDRLDSEDPKPFGDDDDDDEDDDDAGEEWKHG